MAREGRGCRGALGHLELRLAARAHALDLTKRQPRAGVVDVGVWAQHDVFSPEALVGGVPRAALPEVVLHKERLEVAQVVAQCLFLE